MPVLPSTIKDWLNARGITDEILEVNGINWNGSQIVIPVKDRQGNFLFNKYRRNPFGPTDVPKYKYQTGTTAQLYNAHKLNRACSVIITEGETDALRLESAGYLAVTSTGGAGTFRDEWVALLAGKDVYVCFDNDDAGIKGAVKVLTKLPAKMVLIPHYKDVKDITDYFQHNGSFPILLEQAQSFPILSKPVPEFKFIKDVEVQKKKYRDALNDLVFQERNARIRGLPRRHFEAIRQLLLNAINGLEHEARRMRFFNNPSHLNENYGISQADIMRAKELVPIDTLYDGQLRRFGDLATGKCPFHNEDTGSFTIYIKQNKFYCYGCTTHGDIIDFVMKIENIDFVSAVKRLLHK